MAKNYKNANTARNGKLSKTMMVLGSGRCKDYLLNFNVEFNMDNTSSANEDVPSASPYMYYPPQNNTIPSIDCYFSLEHLGFYDRVVKIYPPQVCKLQYVIDNFVLPEVEGIMNNEHIIIDEIIHPDEPIEEVRCVLSFEDYLTFLFWAEEWGDGYELSNMISVVVNDRMDFLLSLEDFLQFYYIITRTNMYDAAVQMLKENHIL